MAYNPTATPLPVTFSDGFTMTVDAHSMRASNKSKDPVATQTYPDFTQQTPTSRFFLSSTKDASSGDYTLLSGQTGTGESSVNIPPPVPVVANIASTKGATESGTTVTITTTAAHGYLPGQTVQIANVGVAGYNGTFSIQSVPSPTTFTYTASQSNLPDSGGGTSTSYNYFNPPINAAQKATFQVTGLSGTLMSDSAGASYSF